MPGERERASVSGRLPSPRNLYREGRVPRSNATSRRAQVVGRQLARRSHKVWIDLTMASRKRTTAPKASAALTGSWMALLAATTLGMDGANTVRAEVIGEGDLAESGDYRLVVQSYDAEGGKMPGDRSRPVGSYQRAVTAAELRAGVHVNLLELRAPSATEGKGVEPVLVAWVEDGKPDLEFDGRMARPGPGSSMVGLVRRGVRQANVQIRLNGKLAA